MSFDPYAPPSPAHSEAAPLPTPAHVAPQRFEASEVVGVAWEHVKRNAGLLVVGSALWLSVSGGVLATSSSQRSPGPMERASRKARTPRVVRASWRATAAGFSADACARKRS